MVYGLLIHHRYVLSEYKGVLNGYQGVLNDYQGVLNDYQGVLNDYQGVLNDYQGVLLTSMLVTMTVTSDDVMVHVTWVGQMSQKTACKGYYWKQRPS